MNKSVRALEFSLHKYIALYTTKIKVAVRTMMVETHVTFT